MIRKEIRPRDDGRRRKEAECDEDLTLTSEESAGSCCWRHGIRDMSGMLVLQQHSVVYLIADGQEELDQLDRFQQSLAQP